MGDSRRWMYEGWRKNDPSLEWIQKTEDFINRVFSSSRNGRVWCPCSVCKNYQRQTKKEMSGHLCKNGYVPNYEVWVHHGEELPRGYAPEGQDDFDPDLDRMEEMVQDLREDPDLVFPDNPEDPQPPEVKKFFELLKAAEEPLHEHTRVTILAFVTRLMAIKSKFAFSINCLNELLNLISDVLPPNHKMPKDVYQSRKLLSGLGMEYQKIDVCPDNCMLFWKENEKLDKCLRCSKSRFVEVVNEDGDKLTTEVAKKQLRYMPLTPRVKRLFLSKNTAKQMRWHKERDRENPQVMMHPSDSDAWKALDDFDSDFASEARNIRIGLATDGFSPFNMTASPYSCWPVFAVPYNLPPHLCMKYDYMFLCLIIPGPEHPGKHLNVMLEPLVDELKKLWEGVEAYDCYKKERFNLRVAYLWSIHDFMAYGIFAGWSCHGKLTCPICGKDTDCFRLEFGGKICYFDCHRCFLPLDHPFRFEANQFRKDTIVTKGPPKRLSGAEIHAALDNLKPDGTGYLGFGIEHNWTHKCSLWELPYTEALILMHNIDVMHQERNVAESIISTCMDFPDKTKDNIKARKDLEKICNRPSLVLLQSGAKPRASFCLKSKQKKEVMVWLKNLKFPDGYAAGFRRSVNLRTGKMNGLKSHDYHIIMERLLPVMFRGYLNNDVWTALAELSYFYRQLCAKEIKKDVMEKLEKEIPVLICKLEKIFPPGFFNPMQHLLVHLPYEAKIGGPVQYRWMYHIERALKKLSAMVGNKGRVEGCIAEEFKYKEISAFTSVYFAEEHNVNAPTLRYNVDQAGPCSKLKILSFEGKTVGASTEYHIGREEKLDALLYMYENMEEMTPYFK